MKHEYNNDFTTSHLNFEVGEGGGWRVIIMHTL